MQEYRDAIDCFHDKDFEDLTEAWGETNAWNRQLNGYPPLTG